MAFTVQYQTVQANGSAIFNIPGSVSSYIVGISNFSFTFGNTDHHVQQLSLSLGLPGQPMSTADQTQIPVQVQATLSDASGHMIDSAQSSVTVAILAWTGAASAQVMLESATVNNNQNTSIPVPTGTPVSGLQSIVSGFDLAYPSGVDHDVQAVGIGISALSQTQGFASLGGNASMNDASGNYCNGSGGTTATVTGSLLATSLSSPGLVMQALLQQQTNDVSVNLGTTLADAVVLITGFQLQYPGSVDHWIKTIGAGPTSYKLWGGPPVSPYNANVEIFNAQALMSDNSGHSQDNTASNVSLVVIGVPL